MGVPLIVTADDYGLTAGTSRAILEAHHTGMVTATSVLAVGSGARASLAWLDDAPNLAVGVHLALVGEDPPVLTATEIPTLLDRRGHLPASWHGLVPRLVAGRIDPADVDRELRAQLAIVAAHRRIDHLDTHQHTHLWPTVAEVVVELARAHAIPRVRVPRPSSIGVRAVAISRLAAALERRLDNAGIRRTDRFVGLDEAGRWTLERLSLAIRRLATAPGTVEINTHPGPGHDEDRRRYRWNYGWSSELDALTSPSLRQEVEGCGFTLTGVLDGAS